MMKRLPKPVWALLLLLPFYSIAQDFVPPADPVLSSKEDYAKYEKDVISSAKWLESKAVGVEMEKRKQVGAFIIKWLSGSPTVNVAITPFQMKLADKNPQFLVLYMAAAARYCLENNYSKDTLKTTTAAVKSILACYGLGGDITKNKVLERAITANKEGKLEEWVRGNMGHL
ncbi:MAG TPA: hypothetical protein VGM41_12540 [Chitinophagaceae bacterium]|jgi:hypothetical protein